MNKKPKLKKVAARIRRKKHVRRNLFGVAEMPRLSVFRSNCHIYAQIINDNDGNTIVSCNSNMKEIKSMIDSNENIKTKTDIATLIGEELAKKALAANISAIVFDRNGYLYHGRVKALAEGARKGGLKF
ncbi:MAG: 50S ribosomal protein L18 [Candidatus Delongbacteria bacterium]|nr:50S ribosomal protein L18 [Candidatus Delongbacteria bacterium]MBN2836421.1 50S ribosomal protein L18 [Candidatus Delongbacteria bacterium]